MLLKNKVAFVTGGARGIGAAIVRKMAEQGAAVGFSYRNDTAAAAEQLEWAEKNGLRVAAWQADATQAESAERVLHEVVARWGGLDILVNNAGQTADALLADISLDAWRSVLAVNLEAAFLHTRAVLRLMLPVRNGVILNIGSVVGQHGNTGQAAYAAAKAGLVGLTKSVAKEAGPRNIRCNLISPGLIETAMSAEVREKMGAALLKNIPLRYLGSPDDVAELAVFLASDRARYITGQVVSVCGGLSA